MASQLSNSSCVKEMKQQKYKTETLINEITLNSRNKVHCVYLIFYKEAKNTSEQLKSTGIMPSIYFSHNYMKLEINKIGVFGKFKSVWMLNITILNHWGNGK